MKNNVSLHQGQYEALATDKRIILEMAGQGGGKSHTIGFRTAVFASMFPETIGLICANTYTQLSDATITRCKEVWENSFGWTEYHKKNNVDGDYIVGLKPPLHFKQHKIFDKYHNKIFFRNGKVYIFGSMDAYENIDGIEVAHVEMDETKDTREKAVKDVVIGRCRQAGIYWDSERNWYTKDKTKKPLNPIAIHTSPNMGNNDWLIEMFKLKGYSKEMLPILYRKDVFVKETDLFKIVIYPTHLNQRNLPEDYIPTQIGTKSKYEALKLVYGYPFGAVGGEFYPYFNRLLHVRNIQPKPTGVKHITFDFNVVPYMTMLSAQIRYQVRYIDAQGVKHDEPDKGRMPIEVMIIEFIKEYCLETPLNTTEQCCKHFIEDNAGNPSLEVFYYGDASGNARIEGLGSLTNFKIVEQHLKMYLIEGSKRVRGVNIGVLTRRDLMNRIFEGKIPEVEIYFDEEMVNTIRDFEYLKLGADGKLKEKAKDKDTGALYEKIGHTSDATEYLVCEILKHYITIN